MNSITNILNSISEPLNFLLAPPYCAVCEKLITEKNKYFEYLCLECYDSLPVTSDSRELLSRLSERDNSSLLSVHSLMNLKENHKYMNLIHNLKYYGFRKVGYELGKELGRFLKINNNIDYDYVIPVPIHSAKKRERGYNQSDYIAKGVSEFTSIPLSVQLTSRNKYTQTQTRLNKSERKSNVSDIFKINIKSISIVNKSIIIVDDVFTTGSTINSLAELLLESGAKKIAAATLASA